MVTKERVAIVDILRGFALLLIVLIHFVEHFDLFKRPEVNFLFSQELDGKVMKNVFLFISGKAYSIFALLFGWSFYQQMARRQASNGDYSMTFLWRMTVLLVIGLVHSLFYRGDILHIYALLAFPLLFFNRFSSKVLLLAVLLFLLQVPTIYQLIRSVSDAGFEYTTPFKSYFKEGNEVYASGSLKEVISYNVWKGRMTVWAWSYDNGRFTQLLGLFILGVILGRKKIVERIDTFRRVLTFLLFSGVFVYFLLSVVMGFIRTSEISEEQLKQFNVLLTSYSNLAITFVFISLVTLAYLKFKNASIFKLLSSYGKMSLSNYVFQAVFGVLFFYGFGLSMYKYLGSTWSLILGFFVFVVQARLSKFWNERFYYGPLEWLWRCATYFDLSTRFVRRPVEDPG